LDQAILDQGLREVEKLLQAQGGKTLEDFELPILAQLAAPGDTIVSKERARYNVTWQAQQLVRDVPLLNQHQRSIYDNVIDAIHDPRPLDKTFFVDGLGGAGKTFLYECLLSKVRSISDGIFWHCNPAFGGRLHSSTWVPVTFEHNPTVLNPTVPNPLVPSPPVPSSTVSCPSPQPSLPMPNLCPVPKTD
jgi:hypothetical protein